MWGTIVNASYLAAIILAIVGIAKLFFKKFKTKFPKLYKAAFFLLSLILVVCGSVVAQLYIIGGSLATFEFAVFILTTGCIVFGGYTGYECSGVKAGVKTIVSKFSVLAQGNPDSAYNKFIKKYGLDEAIKQNQKAIEGAEKKANEEVMTEIKSEESNTIIVEEKKEGE